jgi:hypothetical protein
VSYAKVDHVTSNMDNLTGADLDRHISDVKQKLTGEFHTEDDARASKVAVVVDEERRRFADAHIAAFLPVLIERAARERLRSVS